MKQLIMCNDSTVTYGKNFDNSANVLDNGSIGILDGNTLLTSSATALKSNVLTIVMGDANNNIRYLGGIDIAALRYTESPYQALVPKSAKITISLGTHASGNVYAICVLKKGMLLNERNKYYAEAIAMYNDTADTIATRLLKSLNASIKDFATATINSGKTEITITGIGNVDFDIQGCERLINSVVTVLTPYTPAVNDKDYMKSLWMQCIGNNGNFYTDNCNDMYTTPSFVDAYKSINLFFKSPRIGRQIPDENVTQEIILAFNNTNAQYSTIKSVINKIISLSKAASGNTIA